MSQWETDKSLPHSKALIEMAYLGVNINWLLIGDGEMIMERLFSQESEGLFSEKQLKQIERLIDGRIDKGLLEKDDSIK